MALSRDLKRKANVPSDLTAGDNGDLDGGRNGGMEEWRSCLQINYYFSQWLAEGWNSLHGCKRSRNRDRQTWAEETEDKRKRSALQ